MKKPALKLFAVMILVFSALGAGFSGMTAPAVAGCNDDAGPGIDWKDCRKRNLIMTGLDFSGSDFSFSDLSSSDLRNSNFDKSNFTKATMLRSSLADASAQNTDFSGILASRSDFSGGNFSNSTFEKSELYRSDFSRANLKNANLSKAELARVLLSGANLTNSQLEFSNLARADLRGIEFEGELSLNGAFLFLTRIEGLDMGRITNLSQWQVDMACGDDDTKLPEGLKNPGTWPCEEDS